MGAGAIARPAGLGTGHRLDCFRTPRPVHEIPPGQSPYGETMNRFDETYWEGARNAALAVYRVVREREDVPDDIRRFAEQLLGATGDKRNSSFLEQLGIRSP